MQILHLTSVAEVEPLAQERQLGKRADGRNAAEVEPDGRRLRLMSDDESSVPHPFASWRRTYGRIPP